MGRFASLQHAHTRLNQERHAIGFELPNSGIIGRTSVREGCLAPAGVHVSSADILISSPCCRGFHDTGASSPLDHATRFLPSARIQKVVYLAHTHVPGFLLLLAVLWVTRIVDVDLADQ